MTAEADFNDDGVIDFEEFVGLVMRMLLFFFIYFYKNYKHFTMKNLISSI